MVADDGTISLRYEVKGNVYRVISTKYGSGYSVWAARDKIKNETTGDVVEKTRKEWHEIFKRFVNESNTTTRKTA